MGNLDKLLNLKHKGKSNNVSLAHVLLFFHIFIASNFIGDLYSGQLIDFIKSNRYVQHIIGFISMLIIIDEFGLVRDPWLISIYGTVAYSWFILTTKLDLHWNIAIIGLLVIGFMYENKMFNREAESKDDQALEEKDRKKIRRSNKAMKRIVYLSILAITFIGSFLYFNRKKNQYGGEFDPVKFLFDGRQKCKC